MLATLQAKLIAGAVVVIVLAGIALTIYNKGKSAGYVEGQRAQLEIDRQQSEQDRALFLAELQKYQERDDAAKVEIEHRDSEIRQLQGARAAIRHKVYSIPASGLISDIQGRLGDVPTQTLSELQLRRIDEAIIENSNLAAQVAALEAKSAEQDKRIDAIEHQRDAAIASYNKLVPLYTKAYNASQKKHSMFVKIITFGLVRDRKLDLPDPVTLEHP